MYVSKLCKLSRWSHLKPHDLIYLIIIIQLNEETRGMRVSATVHWFTFCNSDGTQGNTLYCVQLLFPTLIISVIYQWMKRWLYHVNQLIYIVLTKHILRYAGSNMYIAKRSFEITRSTRRELSAVTAAVVHCTKIKLLIGICALNWIRSDCCSLYETLICTITLSHESKMMSQVNLKTVKPKNKSERSCHRHIRFIVD